MGVKISDLPIVAVPALTDIFPIVQSGITYQESVTQLSALLLASGTVSSITGTANQVIASAPVGAVVLSLPQSIATTSDVTFGSITFSPTTKGIVGTTVNNDAAPGYVGQVISSIVLVGAAVPLSTGATSNVTSISLTSGDWNVYGEVWLTAGATTVGSLQYSAITSTSATIPSVPALATPMTGLTAVWTTATNGLPIMAVGPARVSIAGTTTTYLVTNLIFTTSTAAAYGKIFARRIR